MLRTRILAAATAALLMLGMSVGGAGAAMATPPAEPTVPAGVTITYDNGVTCNGIGYTKPSSLDNINGGTGNAVFAWGTLSWSGSVVSWTVNPGWTVDLCVKGGNTWPLAEIDLGSYTGSSFTLPQGISHLGYIAVPPVASASIVTSPRDCDTPTTWNFDTDSISNATWGEPFVEDGLIKIVATATGGALFAGGATTKTFTAPYEEAGGENCGPPLATAAITIGAPDCFVGTSLTPTVESSSNVTWGTPVIDEVLGTITIVATASGEALFEDGLSGVSPDRTTRTFTVDYEGPTDDCVLPAIGVVADAAKITCDLDGWFRFGPGLGVSTEDAALLDWTVGPAEYAGDTATGVQHPVSETVTITITVSLDDSAEGDYALVDESTNGVVDPVTGDITFTFEFREAVDCPTLEGSTAVSQCEQDAPYLEWTIDLTDAGESISFPTNATLTLRSKTDPSKFYEFPAYELTGTGASTGSALWPGAAIDGDGNGTAWPGWAFVDGEWVVDDTNFGWVRGADVELFIQVNPEIAIDVSYPNATPDCANPPVVVPDITVVDECVGTGREAVQTATFTVTSAPNLRYVYTVGDGPETDVVFPDGETEVTIAVAPLAIVTVTAIPDADFRLADGTEPFTYTFIGAAFCPGTFPATEADAELVLPDCLGNPGSVTLTNEGGVIWTLNGETVAGNSTYDITPGTQVELTAALEGPSDEFPGGWTWSDPQQQTEWSELFPVADDDCLPTLAFSGAGSITTWLGVAAVLMTLAGMGFVLRRHRVEV